MNKFVARLNRRVAQPIAGGLRWADLTCLGDREPLRPAATQWLASVCWSGILVASGNSAIARCRALLRLTQPRHRPPMLQALKANGGYTPLLVRLPASPRWTQATLTPPPAI